MTLRTPSDEAIAAAFKRDWDRMMLPYNIPRPDPPAGSPCYPGSKHWTHGGLPKPEKVEHSNPWGLKP